MPSTDRQPRRGPVRLVRWVAGLGAPGATRNVERLLREQQVAAAALERRLAAIATAPAPRRRAAA